MTRLMSAAEVEAKSAKNRAAHTPIGARKVRLLQDETPKQRGRPKGKWRPAHPIEHDEQVMICNWWRAHCKDFGLDERVLFAIPNSSKLTAAGRIYKWAEGLRSGVPDLMLAVPENIITQICPAHGLYIELKRIGVGKVTPEQAEYHELLKGQGYAVEVCYGHAAAIDVIKGYLGRA